MSWVPRRGRPVAMPSDFTPVRGRTIDARARVAWLLRVSRLAISPGPATVFVAKLAQFDCILGPSTLCRYETGTEPVPASVVRAYELALGLPAGQLLGACAGLDRTFGSALATETAPEQPSRAEIIHSLGEWEARVAAGSMRGIDWFRAAEMLSHPAGPVLLPSVVRSWVGQLVNETMRAVREASTTRVHALWLLMSDPGMSSTVLEAIEATIDEPGAQSVTDVLTVLGSSADPMVARWLIDRFERSEGEHQWGAAYGLLGMICRGTLPVDLVPTVSRAVLDAASEGLDRGRPAFMIAQRLSAELTQQVVSRLGCYPAPTVSGARVQSPSGLSLYRSAALQESGLDDLMLDRLLREALSPDFVERRHHSLLLLGASPYRNTLANVAVGLVPNATDAYLSDSASHCLTYIAGENQRQKLVDLLTTEPRHRTSVLAALTRCGGVPSTVDLTAISEDPDHVSGAMYAAGMSDHPALRVFAASTGLFGQEIQRSAQWWRRTGAAVTDLSLSQQVDAPMLHLAAG